MTNTRKKMTRDERHATVILDHLRRDGKPVVDREWAKGKTPQEIIARFEELVDWDHVIPRAIDGSDDPWNRQALARDVDHPTKTKRDVKEIAKTKRITATTEQFRKRILATKLGQGESAERKKSKFRRPPPGWEYDWKAGRYRKLEGEQS